MMKHSIHSAITPSPAFDCDFVRAAQGARLQKPETSLRHGVVPSRNHRLAALESKWAGRPAAGLRACGKNSRANAYSSHGEDLAVAGRTIGARSGCGSLASFITRTNDSAIGA